MPPPEKNKISLPILVTFHEPQTGIDVTKIPSMSQTQALRRHGENVTPHTKHAEEEMNKKLQTTQGG